MTLRDINLSQYRNQFTGYTELRLQENRITHHELLNGNLVKNSRTSELGSSARCWNKGRWGFASSADLTEGKLKTVISSAIDNADYLAGKQVGDYKALPESQFKCEKDLTTKKTRVGPSVPIDFLRSLDEYIDKKYPVIKSRKLILVQEDIEKRLITSSGSEVFTLLPRLRFIIILIVENDRGEPINLMEPICHGGRQFEDVFIDPAIFYPIIDRLQDHLLRKREAVLAKAGRRTVILDNELTGILAHEAIGHTTEADLVLGGSVAGDNIGRRVASKRISMVDFAHTYQGEQVPVPVWVDDEGTEAKDACLIEEGVLKGFMHNRESAVYFDHPLTGNARASLFSDEPLIRMRNTTILPGSDKLEDMIASVEDGYYLIQSSNGQADSTTEFMFGVILGYEIKHGKLGRAITDTTISGVAFDMLKSVSMVSDELHWKCSGYCVKGGQPMVVSFGGPALKCEINIGGQ